MVAEFVTNCQQLFFAVQLHEEVIRNRVEYERMMEKLKNDRMRYEELLSKGEESGEKTSMKKVVCHIV